MIIDIYRHTIRKYGPYIPVNYTKGVGSISDHDCYGTTVIQIKPEPRIM